MFTDRPGADPVAAGELCRTFPFFLLLDDPNDLLVAEPSLHSQSSQLRGFHHSGRDTGPQIRTVLLCGSSLITLNSRRWRTSLPQSTGDT